MTKDEALKLALEALENLEHCNFKRRRLDALIAIKQALAQPVQEPVAHTVIAGALFDFMGYLTSRKERIVLSASDDAAPAADAIRDFAKKRGLSLDDAQVREWIDALAQPEERNFCPRWVGLTNNELQPIADEYRILFGSWVEDFARAIEAKLKEKNT